jgi:flagellar biosynthesis protein FlhG
MSDQATQLRELFERGTRIEEAGGTATLVPPSRPTGRVSYAPDHRTATPPSIPASAFRARPEPVRLARAIAVTSGKGGVGKTNIAVNLAAAMSALGRRVCLVDGDLGLANADVLCNVQPRLTLDDVVHDRCRLADALIPTPFGFHLLPGASGVARMADLPQVRQESLLRRVASLERACDVLVIDTGAGIGGSVLAFAAAAHVVLCVATPEPTAITDAYGLIKSLFRREPGGDVRIVVNAARSEVEARGVFRRLDKVSRTFLSHPLGFAGWIPEDPAVREAVRARTPVLALAPRSIASSGLMTLARGIVGDGVTGDEPPCEGFLARLILRVRGRA